MSSPHEADPHVNSEYTRTVTDDAEGDLTLVGVVHDHPASVHRVQATVEDRDPAVVALELSPVALPLFREHATDDATPPSRGGEMSAAIQAAGDARVAGVDAPTGEFLGLLARRVREERSSLRTVGRVIRGVASVTRHAVACGVAGHLARFTPLRFDPDRRVEHECDVGTDPRVQAADERRQVSRSLSLLRATRSPRPLRLRDDVREEHMARRLDALRAEGDVVAVVGVDHLDGIEERLAGA